MHLLRSLLAMVLLTLAIPAAAAGRRSDFTGDGRSDLLWRNGATGQVYLMPMAGGLTQPGAVIWTELDPAWQIVGTGDFDGDGKADILWWNSRTGQVFLLLMDGAMVRWSGFVYTEPDTRWTIQAVADLTGRGKADILWRHSGTGSVYRMPMDGATVLPGGVIWTEPDPAWQIVAADDFTGEGRAGLLWWNSGSGQVYLMRANGVGTASGTLIYTEPDTRWRIVGSGDFDGDGTADLLWRNQSSGQIYEMPMVDGQPRPGAVIYTEARPEWQILGIGDYDGDGRADIVWWNSGTGQVFRLLMTGMAIKAADMIYTEPNLQWRIQGAGTLGSPGIAPGFTLALGNPSPSVNQGQSVSLTVSLNRLNGFQGPATLAVDGLPAGVSATFTPPVIAASSSASLLTLSAAGDAAIGSQTLQVRATSGSLAQAAALALAVGATRTEAVFTPIFADDVETLAPIPGVGFALGATGSITTAASEVINGKASIRGNYDGSTGPIPYLSTSSQIQFKANHSYAVSFNYKIIAAVPSGFEITFFSNKGLAAGAAMPQFLLNAASGAAGSVSRILTLGPYDDYFLLWSMATPGTIVIDDIAVTDVADASVAATANAELGLPTVRPGLSLIWKASVTSDPALVLDGSGSIRLDAGTMATDPSYLPLAPNTQYIIEFKYRMLSRGSDPDSCMGFTLAPAGNIDPTLDAHMSNMLINAESAGTFSTGGMTGSSGVWRILLSALPGVSVIIDDLTVYRIDNQPSNALPARLANLDKALFPRLGMQHNASSIRGARGQFIGGVPYSTSMKAIEARLSMADLVSGMNMDYLAGEPDYLYRLKLLNPSIALLFYRVSQEQSVQQPGTDASFSFEYDFYKNMSQLWYLNDSGGNAVYETDYPAIRFMNISDYCQVDGGQTFSTYLTGWMKNRLMNNGLWDGAFFDNCFARANMHIPNVYDPAKFDFDWNRNQLRDETLAQTTEMTQKGAYAIIDGLRSKIGGYQLITANNGPLPELELAARVNGFYLEAFNHNWELSGQLHYHSEVGWRTFLEHYLKSQSQIQSPRLNLLEGVGVEAGGPDPAVDYSKITPNDLLKNRFALGTALLGDGFYWYDLCDNQGNPVWFDEYAVDGHGVAVEDRAAKGYLGKALNAPVELATASVPLFQLDLSTGALPAWLGTASAPNVYVSSAVQDQINGRNAIVIDNPDHTIDSGSSFFTNPAVLAFAAGTTYQLSFDWKILETLDNITGLFTSFGGSKGHDNFGGNEVMKGAAGTTTLPITVDAADTWAFTVYLQNGGKVAINNLRVAQGGPGPWRRDFENGFVLVNPLLSPHTFTPGELAGALKRTGIHRILGTQAPDVNSGLPVADTLTLQPFDAIILLADPIPAAN